MLQDAVSHTLRFAALVLLLGAAAGPARGDDAAVLTSQTETQVTPNFKEKTHLNELRENRILISFLQAQLC